VTVLNFTPVVRYSTRICHWPPVVLLYTAEVFDIIASFRLTGHSYADDTQVYISAPVSETQQAAARLAECVGCLDQWMGENRLKLNAEKTQLNGSS